MKQKILVLLLVLAAVLAGCQSAAEPVPAQTETAAEATDSPAPEMTDAPTPEPDPTPTSQPTPQPTPEPANASQALSDTVFMLPDTLFENNTMSIVLDTVTAKNADTVLLSFSVENKSAYTLQFGLNAMCVNYIMVPEYYMYHQEVAPNSAGVYNFEFSFQRLGQLGIEAVQNIQFEYSVLDADYVNKYNGLYTLPNDYDLAAYTIDWDYPLIASNNYFDVYWVDAYKDMEGHDQYELVFHNKCDLYMYFSLPGLAINEKSIEVNLGTNVLPGAIYWHTGTIYSYFSDFLKEYESAVSVEIDMRGSRGTVGYNQFKLKEKYTIDESIVVDYGEYDGQSIYDENNVKVGIKRVHDDYLNQNTVEFYFENNRDETLFILIPPDMTVDGQNITEHTYIFSVLPNTHLTQKIYMDGRLPEEDAEMVVNFEIKYEYGDRPETKTITFTLLQ